MITFSVLSSSSNQTDNLVNSSESALLTKAAAASTDRRAVPNQDSAPRWMIHPRGPAQPGAAAFAREDHQIVGPSPTLAQYGGLSLALRLGRRRQHRARRRGDRRCASPPALSSRAYPRRRRLPPPHAPQQYVIPHLLLAL